MFARPPYCESASAFLAALQSGPMGQAESRQLAALLQSGPCGVVPAPGVVAGLETSRAAPPGLVGLLEGRLTTALLPGALITAPPAILWCGTCDRRGLPRAR